MLVPITLVAGPDPMVSMGRSRAFGSGMIDLSPRTIINRALIFIIEVFGDAARDDDVAPGIFPNHRLCLKLMLGIPYRILVSDEKTMVYSSMIFEELIERVNDQWFPFLFIVMMPSGNTDNGVLGNQ